MAHWLWCTTGYTYTYTGSGSVRWRLYNICQIAALVTGYLNIIQPYRSQFHITLPVRSNMKVINRHPISETWTNWIKHKRNIDQIISLAIYGSFLFSFYKIDLVSFYRFIIILFIFIIRYVFAFSAPLSLFILFYLFLAYSQLYIYSIGYCCYCIVACLPWHILSFSQSQDHHTQNTFAFWYQTICNE